MYAMEAHCPYHYVGETMDDAMEEEGTAADEDMVVGQVLDELGINMGNAVPEAPVGLATSSAPAAAEPSPTGSTLFTLLYVLPRHLRY